jgi:osmotically-inducible protein OsmY
MNSQSHNTLQHLTVRAIPALALTAALTAAMAASAFAGDDHSKADEWQGKAHDAWLDGKIETSYLLNRYLNPFTIDTAVKNGVVTLSGDVESEIDKELAEAIAKGTDGVTEVHNELQVIAGSRDANQQQAGDARDFGDFVDDATITARVKYALIENGSTDGLSIDVDTMNREVTLSGEVDSDQQKQLAERIAENVDGVAGVKSELRVAGQS